MDLLANRTFNAGAVQEERPYLSTACVIDPSFIFCGSTCHLSAKRLPEFTFAPTPLSNQQLWYGLARRFTSGKLWRVSKVAPTALFTLTLNDSR
jgi:hypothetical protein